jgi:phenylpropionate dioxygenase-like ring-hydroxylating dioxygenase large terminal subunit
MVDSLDAFITPEQRASIRAPIEKARTFPRQAFTSEDFFKFEMEGIFYKQWVALCFSQQVEEQGSLLPIVFAGIPLLVAHGNDDKVRIFHNIVPYDGCLAVIDPIKDQQEIVTPYHGWRYDFAGKLTSIPYWDGSEQGDLQAIQQCSGDLVEVSCQNEGGILFINLSDKPESFAHTMKPLRNVLSEYRTDQMDIGRDKIGKPLLDEESLSTNWKTHYENWAINVLHEGFTHEIYRDSPQIPRVNKVGEKTYCEHIDGYLMGLSYVEKDFSETYELEELPFKHLGGDNKTLPKNAFIGSLFPNLHFAVFPYFIHFIITFPVSAGRTQTIRAQFYETETASNLSFYEDRLDIMEEFCQAGREDGHITEAVQKARHSPIFEQQFYSPFWDQMHYNFSNQVLDALENTYRK